ncbi:MAG: universal stress protein [bacterium]
MKFLVCTDGSERSIATLPHVSQLASVLSAEVILVRVLDPRVDGAGVVATDLEWALQQVEASWKKEMDSSLAESGAIGRVTVVRRGWGNDVANAIVVAANGESADLIALSSRGSGALRHALLGSVAMNVISGSPIAVLVAGPKIAPPEPLGDGYHLAITSDGSPAAWSVLPGLVPMLEGGGAIRVTLVEVATPQGEETATEAKLRATDDLCALRERLPKGVTTSIEVRMAQPGVGIDTALRSILRDIRANSVAMATHGHSALRHLVAGSTALGLIAKSELPVILVKSQPSEPVGKGPNGQQ